MHKFQGIKLAAFDPEDVNVLKLSSFTAMKFLLELVTTGDRNNQSNNLSY